MDSNNILQSLANLRDALQGIESAKQQVVQNVATYDKVRAQLSDTADAVATIVREIQTLTNDVHLTQTTFSDDLDKATCQILKELKGKGENISEQSDKLLQSLENKLSKVTAGIEAAVVSATSELNELSDDKNQELSTVVNTINNKLKTAISTAEKAIADLADDFSKKSEKHLTTMQKSVDSQISRLSAEVNSDISRYVVAEGKIKEQVEAIKNHAVAIKEQVAWFTQSSHELTDNLTAVLQENEAKLSQDLSAFGNELKNKVQESKENLTETITEKSAEQNQAISDAQSKLIEQLQATQKNLSDKVEAQTASIVALVKSNKTLTIINIMLVIILVGLSFMK